MDRIEATSFPSTDGRAGIDSNTGSHLSRSPVAIEKNVDETLMVDPFFTAVGGIRSSDLWSVGSR